MPYPTSAATINDLDPVAQLIDDYMRQNLDMSTWPCSVDTFKRDYTSGCFRMTVIHCDEKLVGFAAWLPSYDLHHCAVGAVCLDMYVAPAYRYRGLGNEYNVSGKALKQLPSLASQSPREMLRGLPTQDMNYQP